MKRFSKIRAKELFVEGMKHCSNCKSVKAHKRFHKNSKTWDGLKQICKDCSKIEQKKSVTNYKASKRRAAYLVQRKLNPEKSLWSGSRSNSKKFGLEHSINIKDIIIPSHCPILNIPLKIGREKATQNSPSLDRIDNSKGYIPGNVWVISWRANSIKKDATLEELERIVKCLREYQNMI